MISRLVQGGSSSGSGSGGSSSNDNNGGVLAFVFVARHLCISLFTPLSAAIPQTNFIILYWTRTYPNYVESRVKQR